MWIHCGEIYGKYNMNIEVVNADYLNVDHSKDIGFLLNSYAVDPMGGRKPLAKNIQNSIANELSKLSYAFSIICYVDGSPAGLTNCFDAFSTFSCKPLINIHDVIVLTEFRGLGVGRKMLEKVEKIAIDKGCCKMTLEVLNGNLVAKSLYKKIGFSAYELAAESGEALLWQKLLL